MIILQPWDIPITQKMISERDSQTQAYNFNGTSGDALMFELMLIWSKIVRKPLNWRHDFIYKDMKIDCKELASKWFNIHNGKTEQYRESIVNGDLTHFLFYNSNRDRSVPLRVGDVLQITPIALCPAREIIKSAIESNKLETEAFVPLEIIKTLGE